jgi:hypothetical protein
VAAALACRFPRIRGRHMDTGGAGFSTAPLTVPGRLGQARVRPSPPPAAAQRPTGGGGPGSVLFRQAERWGNPDDCG